MTAGWPLDYNRMAMRHNCDKTDRLGTCIICEGRLHNLLCQAKLNPDKDCCPERHIRMYELGKTKGINDDSLPMLNPEHIKLKDFWTKKERLMYWGNQRLLI